MLESKLKEMQSKNCKPEKFVLVRGNNQILLKEIIKLMKCQMNEEIAITEC